LSSNWNSVYSNVNTNSATYATVSFTDSKYFPVTGGTITGATRINSNLTVFGSISATGTSYFANTVYSTTSALSVINVGNTGPALYVGNNGTGDIASFYDLDQNIEVLHVGGNNGNFPNVGIKTSVPNKELTVSGEISASGSIWTSGRILSGGQEILSIITPTINSVYTTVQSNSAITWNYQGTDLKALSANWDSTYSTVSSLSSNWNYQGTDLKALSGNWQSTFSTVSSLSSNWGSVYTTTQTNSANWQTAYAYVSANSVNLTATNIFVNNNLTVTNTVSAKYYQGTLLDWMTLVRGYKTTPTLLATIGTGEVYTYVFATTGTDKTYYRYIANDGSEDSFYGNFTNPTLSNLVARKAIIL
jgi:hypothetical protein